MDLTKFTSNGKFLMLALDHRGSFKKMINSQNPDSVADDAIISLKNDIIESLQTVVSGLLIDETWGLKACHEVCRVKPFLLPLEKSGYSDQAGEKITELEYSVSQIKEMGASGAKLLIYFNPNLTSAKKQLETAKKVMEQCKKNDFPFFLEIVTYGDGFKTGLVIESVRTFQEMGIVPDVWKLEYPGEVDACQEITKMVGDTPWILLTGGDDFPTFKSNLEKASKAGAKGFLAGRALWQEICSMKGEEKEKFLKETLKDRFNTIAEIAKSG